MTEGAGAPLLALRGVTKRFGAQGSGGARGGVLANDGVDLDVWPGEVHALIGENGAGKSTLISMLAGLVRPDSGTAALDGASAAQLASLLGSPAAARALGIGVVFQHSALVPTMSVRDNLMLHAGGFRLDRAGALACLADFDQLAGVSIAPDTRVGELSIGQHQLLEIARECAARPRLLVLDEPTAALDERGTAALAERTRTLTVNGAAIILVGHKLDEVLSLADRVTVLRRGRVAAQFPPAEVRGARGSAQLRTRILAAMFGNELAEGARLPAPGAPEAPREGVRATALQLAGVSTDGGCRAGTSLQGIALDGVDLEVAAGEIVGVAGIDGHGQRHLAEVIAGQRAAREGDVLLGGECVNRLGVRERQRRGVRYVTGDRLGEGIVGSLSVALNLVLKRVGERPLWRFGFTDRVRIAREAAALIERYDIRPADPWARAGALSGGNLQKIMLARELAGQPRVVVFENPGAGIDLQTVDVVRGAIREFAAGGGAALVISSDLDELLALADRIAVLSGGRIVGWVANGEDDGGAGATRARIGELIAGGGVR